MAGSDLQGQSGGGGALGCHREADMLCAHFVKALTHDRACQVRLITFAAEMTEIKMAEVGRHDLLYCISGGFIGEMTMSSEDSLLKAPWTIRAILQQLYVVVCLQHQHICGPHSFQDEPVDMTEIREKANVRSIGPHEKSDRILGVVGNGKGFDEDISDLETSAGGEQPAIHPDAELILNGFLGGTIAINRDTKLFRENCQALNVISVFVGDENTGEIFGSPSD
jgi:hypothetical protein